MTSSPTFLSFFSGLGGFDLGFSKSGLRCVGAIDNHAPVLKLYSENFKDTPTGVFDLSIEFPPAEWAENVDVFLMGPPCQGFSTMAGNNFNDKRNDLLLQSARMVSHYRPTIAVIENVPGASNTRHHTQWTATLELLRSAGYRVKVLALTASHYSVPQTRKRNVIVAWCNDVDNVPNVVRTGTVTVGDSLQDLDGIPGHNPVELDPNSRIGMIARAVGPGKRLSNARDGERYVHTWDIPQVFGETTPKQRELLHLVLRLRRRERRRNWGDADPVAPDKLREALSWDPDPEIDNLRSLGYLRDREGGIDLTHTFNGKHVRPDQDGLAPTIDTRILDPHYFLHPTENRGLTIREAARLQTFPDDFKIVAAQREAQKAIGNAVPPRLADAIAKSIRKMLGND